jgi:hypothetical protein
MQAVIDFIVAHQAVLAGLVIGILDLVFALNPNANAPDGVLHMIYLLVSKLVTKTPPQVPPAV